MIPAEIATSRPPLGVAHGSYKTWFSGILKRRSAGWRDGQAFARAAVRRSMSAGLRASLHALRRFPYASQHRNWEAEILEILAKYLILLVSAVGLEPTTP
jgi:hypothetical protein